MTKPAMKATRSIAIAAVIGLGSLSGASIVAAPAVAARSAAPPTVFQVSVSSSLHKLTSTTGHHLKASVSAASFTSGPDYVDIVLDTPTLAESHTWDVPVPGAALTVSSTGSGTLKVPATKLSPYGVIALKITPTGPSRTMMCRGQLASKSRPVALAGKFLFNTHSHGTHKWGSVGSRHVKFSTATITWTYQGASSCGSTIAPCMYGISFDLQQHGVELSGTEAGRTGTLAGRRSVLLSRPKGASRSDSATGGAKITLKIAHSNNATMKVVGTRHAAGSAVLRSTAPGGVGQSCGPADTPVESWNSGFSNGSPVLKLREQIFGAIHARAARTQAYFTKVAR